MQMSDRRDIPVRRTHEKLYSIRIKDIHTFVYPQWEALRWTRAGETQTWTGRMGNKGLRYIQTEYEKNSRKEWLEIM